MSSKIKEKLKALRLEKWDKELSKNLFLTVATLYSFVISLLLVVPFMHREDLRSWHEILIAVIKVLISTALITVLYRLPALLVSLQMKETSDNENRFNTIKDTINEELESLKTTMNDSVESMQEFLKTRSDDMEKTISKNMEKIDNCPRLTAFHTDDHILENKLNSMSHLEPNQRWMMSMFISKLLSFHIKEFKVRMDDTLQYSQFSIEIIRQCTKSVYLTGSMRPSTWLNGLVKKKDCETRSRFFNHILPNDIQFPIDKKNHSVFLNESDFIKERYRIVCLSPEDMKYLFFSEKSVDIYFDINDSENGIKTFFIEWNNDSSPMKPFIYEYALYDESLLFRFERKKLELTIINGKGEDESDEHINEFKEVKKFFEENIKGESEKVDYKTIKKKIRKEKVNLIKDINDNDRLIHKYSYLYSGEKRWSDYLNNESVKYGLPATSAIAELLDWAFEQKVKDTSFNIVEIGPGEGSRILTVCDCLGTTKIVNYSLVDISKRLLEKSEDKLKKRLNDENGEKCFTVEMDCCSNNTKTINRFKHEINDKTVLILSNSTLFTEPHFPWDSLRSAKQTFITLDLYDEDNPPLEDLVKAWRLFLLPLKIFEIPIIDIVIEDLKDFLFTDNASDYDLEKNEYDVFFNLKAYISILYHQDNDAVSIAEALGNDDVSKKKIVAIVKRLWTTEELKSISPSQQDAHKKDLDNEYLEQRTILSNKTHLKVLSCLKFKMHIKGDPTYDCKSHINDYFNKKGFKVDSKIVHERFVGILLTKKRNRP